MSDGLTDYERDVLRAYSRAASAPWWARFLWGRDVYHPRLVWWRRLMVAYFVAILAGVTTASILPPRAPLTAACIAAALATQLAAMILRWHSLRPR